MFKAEMVAPCGLDCNICSQALEKQDPHVIKYFIL